MNSLVSDDNLLAKTIPLAEHIIEPKQDQVVRHLQELLRRTIPVAVIDRCSTQKSAGWNHEEHRNLLQRAIAELGYAFTDPWNRASEGFDPVRIFENLHTDEMHIDSVNIREPRTYLSAHTSEEQSRAIFTNSVPKNATRHSYKESHELFMQGFYNPLLTANEFFTGTLAPGQTTIFRGVDMLPTVHFFETVGSDTRDFYLSRAWLKTAATITAAN